MELILIRHPAPDLPQGLCYGSSDVAVAPATLAAAHAQLAPQLAAALQRGVALYASPLRRCTSLAAMLGAFRTDARLAEMDFGAWEQRPWTDIAREEVDAWAGDLLGYRPGGGETVAEVAARVQGFLDDLRQDAIVICHAGTIRLIAAIAAGAPILQAAEKPNQVKYCEAMRLSLPAKSV